METLEVYVEFMSDSKLKWAYIDDEQLSFIDGKSQKLLLNKGEQYAFSWFIRGAPGTPYSFKIIGAQINIENKNIPLTENKAKGNLWLNVR